MSQFNKKLDQAKSRQKRYYLVAGIMIAAILLSLASLFAVSRGTRVEIEPEEAKEVAEIEVIKGFAFCVGETVYSFLGNPVIKASAPGFKAAAGTISSAQLGRVFPLELFELPGHLIIEISGNNKNLSKTAWTINGRDAGISDKLDLELESGNYTVTIDNPFFQSREMAIEVKRQELKQLVVDLQPVDGFLNISSKPSGAIVVLDGKKVGVTPLQLGRNGGLYSLRVTAGNYIDTVEQLSITRVKPEVKRNYRLKLKKAKITLDLMPKGGTLLVNGIQAIEPLYLDVTVTHRLTYMKSGFYPENQTIILTAGEEKEVSFRLKAEMGKVEISSSPAATIWIDGKNYGVSPVSVNLLAVTHKIIFTKSGYRSVSKAVKAKGDTVQKISVRLLTKYQALLQEAPREFTNKEGIKMKLFVIRDSFVMGAPRSEKGQRANEFQRKISLTKPFYAGFYEITNGQFKKFSSEKAEGDANTPVTSISWQDAAVYCNWLSTKEKLRLFYKIKNGDVVGFDPYADGYRLLSEGEWEWLARKAGKSEQTMFTWGNDTVIPSQSANVADESAKGQVRFYVPRYNDGYPDIAPVGSLNRESSGLYDMAGNISEWVHDVYSIVPPRANSIESNPLGEQHGQAHVVKGANFRSGTLTTLRPAFRGGLTGGRDDTGFRIGRYLYGREDE